MSTDSEPRCDDIELGNVQGAADPKDDNSDANRSDDDTQPTSSRVAGSSAEGSSRSVGWKRTLARLSRFLFEFKAPLAFLLITSAGPRCISTISKMISVAPKRPNAVDGALKSATKKGLTPNTTSHPVIHNAYPSAPAWMKAARGAVPRTVETTVTMLLNSFGIPTYSQLQQLQLEKELLATSSSPDVASSDSSSAPEIDETSASDEKVGGLPFALLVPLASFAIIIVWKYLVAKHTRKLPDAGTPEESRSQLLDEELDNNKDIEGEDDRDTTEAAIRPLVTDTLPPVEDFTRKINETVQRHPTPRSTASSEPTHGLRTADPARQTPRTSMLRSNTEAVLSATMQKRPFPSPSPANPAGAMPEVEEERVATPQKVNTIEPSPIASGHVVDASQMGGEIILALCSQATPVEFSALLAAANKYSIRRIVVCKQQQPFLVSHGISVAEVDNVADFCYRMFPDFAFVGVHMDKRTGIETQQLHCFVHPIDVVYCFDLAASRPSSPASSPNKIGGLPRPDMSWCQAHVHLGDDQPYRGLPALVNVCLLDRYMKLRRAASPSSTVSIDYSTH